VHTVTHIFFLALFARDTLQKLKDLLGVRCLGGALLAGGLTPACRTKQKVFEISLLLKFL
jgi:hypothetical protein